MEKQIGQTKDVGFQFGIRKTFAISSDEMWEFLLSRKGLEIWLGELETEFDLQKEFKTKNGVNGFVRVFKPNSHIRINWQKKNWENLSTVQLRVIGKNEKTTVSFHQEKLLDSIQREEMKEYWNRVMNKITNKLKKENNEKINLTNFRNNHPRFMPKQ